MKKIITIILVIFLMDKISIFGGNGFIGSKFCELYKNQIVKIDKNDYIPKTNNILYLISTVDNYNIHTNLHIDIDTNLKVLMNVLVQAEVHRSRYQVPVG